MNSAAADALVRSGLVRDALVRDALERARSAEIPGPDFPAGPPAGRPGQPVPVPPALDRVLRLSLAGDRLRPAPSAGALHPVDTYLLVGAGCGVEPGRYAYDPGRHRLHSAGPAPDPVPEGAIAVLGVTARRTVSHYGHRGWPLILLDVGHAVAALALAGAEAVCLDVPPPRPPPTAWRPWEVPPSRNRGSVPDLPHSPSGMGGAPTPYALRAGGTPTPQTPAGTTVPPVGPELPLAAVRVTPADPEALDRWAACATSVEARPADAPADLVQAWHVLDALATSGEETGSWRPVQSTTAVQDSVLLARRSAPPGFSGLPSRDDLAAVLVAAEEAWPDGPRWCLAVSGPEPGLVVSDERGGLQAMAKGDVLPTLAVWAAGQGWVADVGAVLLAYGCPSDADPARVRRDHLLAGYGVGHAQAAATALGLASRPLGSWQGADLGAALGERTGRDWLIHGLALGRHTQGEDPS